MDELAKIFKALSDKNRLAIFKTIREGFDCCTVQPDGTIEQNGNTVSEIAAEFDLSQPGNFISNFEPLTREQVAEMAEYVVDFDAFSSPMQFGPQIRIPVSLPMSISCS